LVRGVCENGIMLIIPYLLKDERVNFSVFAHYPFRAACMNGHLEMAKLLLESKNY